MKTTPTIQKLFRRVPLSEQKSDSIYWQSQPYPVRLKTLEQIRQEYHRWKYGAEPRLQRVYSIVKR